MTPHPDADIVPDARAPRGGIEVALDERRLRLVASTLLGGLALVGIGVLDAITGALRLSVLYVAVIILMTWLNGRGAGLAFAVASGLALVLANTMGGNELISDPVFLVSVGSDVLVFGLCVFGTNGLHEGLERERLRRRNLARYLPASFAEQLANQGMRALNSRSSTATIMFVDIRGFTRLSRALPPPRLFALLKDYRRTVLAAVTTHGGFVDKFVGDGALAVFGVDGAADSAAAAVSAALDILARLDSPAATDGRAAGPQLRVGIGLHQGGVILGAIGDDERLEFTVLGDTVNVAARIEELTRELGLPLLVSDAVYVALPPALRGACTWAQLCVRDVRGLSGSLALAYPMI